MKFVSVVNIFIVLCLFCSCKEDRYHAQLNEIETVCDSVPLQAIEMLGKISDAVLSDNDRHYKDLLFIKARDNAYIPHSSDSLILDVIKYYADSSDKIRYAESLYYGGRVYSDMGDYPSARQYFEDALNEIPKTPAAINLKSRILSQISDLSISIRLLNDARRYTEEALKTDMQIKNPVSIMYDYEQLGAIDMLDQLYDSAENHYGKAREMAVSLNNKDSVSLTVSLAAIKYYNGEIDHALTLIRPVINDIDSMQRNTALAFACCIYQKANITDTAILFAKELISRNDSFNRKTGYSVLLSDEILPLMPFDTVIEYVKNYRYEIESSLNKNSDQSVFMQNSFYNYQTHLRDKEKAEKASIRQQRENMILFFLALGLLLIIICFVVINKYRIKKLQIALFTLTQMRLEITDNYSTQMPREESESREESKNESELNSNQHLLSNNSQKRNPVYNWSENIKCQIQNELNELLENAPVETKIPKTILESEVYNRIYHNIAEKNVINENDITWHELEEIIFQCFPLFEMRLNNLGDRKLNISERHILMMVKLGIAPTDMASVMGRSKSTISFNRHSIANKLFGKKMKTKEIDHLIRMI